MTKRRAIIAGNWKLNNTVKESLELVAGLVREFKGMRDLDIVVCPPYTSLHAVAKALAKSHIQLGAQDVFWQDAGAYTGEVSSPMLKEAGCRFVIIGHSERRSYFGETNASVNKKVQAALQHGISPIMCVGERLEEREAGKTFTVIEDHVVNGLKEITAEQMEKIVLAYEPVWAIGTGKTATPAQAQEAHAFIRGLLEKLFGKDVAAMVRIQYGGSIKPDNTADLMAQDDVDGALVGGASLDLNSFVEIVKRSR
ncbi:MAG: triose-phosphate isomerase [Candidatus Omnitrophota bacterium]